MQILQVAVVGSGPAAEFVAFTRISDTILRPMTLAVCTASARTPSYAAGLVLAEIEHGFAQLGYPASIEPVAPGVSRAAP